MEEKIVIEDEVLEEEKIEDEGEEGSSHSDLVGKLVGCGALIAGGYIISKIKNDPKRLEKKNNRKEERLHKAEIRNSKFKRIKEILVEKEIPKTTKEK